MVNSQPCQTFTEGFLHSEIFTSDPTSPHLSLHRPLERHLSVRLLGLVTHGTRFKHHSGIVATIITTNCVGAGCLLPLATVMGPVSVKYDPEQEQV